MAMLCGSISGVAICLKSVEVDGAVIVPDEDDGVDADELVEAAVVGSGRGGNAENMGWSLTH